ncbi:hypothetical protein KQ941_01365 [Paenibacillus xylanexedens]|uniref:hypothetical protein n=1 Tax=Paenibacillus xylanexedens TaxID=528191 RepID=UPI001F328454|nr:hypothetical protein [Paenibacillus xylanexedens]MCF7753074.1 hypothetical protein [Paenibacillus xylanexedens]
MRNITKRSRSNKHTFTKCFFPSVGLVILITTATGCGLERDEHTVQFQQLQQPNENGESLPVWLDVYSKSVIQDVYSPRGSSEVLP